MLKIQKIKLFHCKLFYYILSNHYLTICLLRYNIACCESLLNNTDSALSYLSQAISLGYSDVDHLSSDPDFTSIKQTPAFQELINKLRNPDGVNVVSPDQTIKEEKNNSTTTDLSSDNEIDCSIDRPIRPECKYGANCYRRNPDHLLQFYHPRKEDEIKENIETSNGDNSTDMNELLDALSVMGFNNRSLNTKVLTTTSGDLKKAIDILLLEDSNE